MKIATIFKLQFVKSITDAVVFKVLKQLQYFTGIFLTTGILIKLFHCMMYLIRSLEFKIWLSRLFLCNVREHVFVHYNYLKSVTQGNLNCKVGWVIFLFFVYFVCVSTYYSLKMCVLICNSNEILKIMLLEREREQVLSAQMLKRV